MAFVALLLAAFGALCYAAAAEEVLDQWTTLHGGSGQDRAYGLEVDSADAIIVAGVSGSSTLDGQANAGGWDVMVMKFSSAGTHQWTVLLGGSSHDRAYGLEVDSCDAIIVAGYSSSTDLDSQTNAGENDVMVMKFSSAGTHQWTVLHGGSDSESAYSLKVDSADAIIVAGYSSSTDLDNQTNAGSDDVMVMKFSSAGTHQWTVLHGGSGLDQAHSLEVDSADAIIVGGYSSSTDLDGQANAGSSDVMVMKFSSAGTHQWTVLHGGSGYDQAHGLEVDASGNIFVAGKTSSTDLDGQSNAGDDDVMVVKISSDGALAWTVLFGGSRYEEVHGIKVHASGNIFVAGTTQSTDLDGQSNAGSYDVMVMKFQAPTTTTTQTTVTLTTTTSLTTSSTSSSSTSSSTSSSSSTSTTTSTSTSTASTSSTSTSSTSTSSTSTSSTSTSSTSTSSTSTSSTSTSSTSTSRTSITSTSTSTTSRTSSISSTSTSSTSTTSATRTSSTSTSSTSTSSTSTSSTSTTSATRTSSTSTSTTSTYSTSTTTTISTTSSTTTATATHTIVTTTRTKLPQTGITQYQLEALEEQRRQEAAAAVAEAEAGEDDAVQDALKLLNKTSPAPPGLLGQVCIKTGAGPVQVAALSVESLSDADGRAEISAGAETGASLEISLGLLEEVAGAGGAGAGNSMILLSIAGLNEDAASSLATDDVRAEVGARRLASALRSQPISISFRSADGTRIDVQNLTTPMKMRLKADDPNATCAYWDESTARWSSEGVQTLSSEEPGFIQCSTTHLSIFAGIIEVAVRNVLLRLECSTLGLLLQLEALKKLLDGEWLGHPATWVAALMVVVFGSLLVLARRLDRYHLRKFPLKERELLLLRLHLDGGDDAVGLAGCAALCAVIDAVFHFFGWLRGTVYMVLQSIYERRLDLLVTVAVRSLRKLLTMSVVHRSIGLLQIYRSSTAQDTVRVLQSAFGAVAPENPEFEDSDRRRITAMRRSPSMRRDSQTALTQAHALNGFVKESGAGAAMQFLNGNVLTRVALLFPAVHGWVGLQQFSISHSNVIRAALFSMKAFSGAAFDAVWFSTSAQPGSNPECSPAVVTWTYVGQAVITGVASAMVSDVIILMFSKVVIAKVKKKTIWTDKAKSAHRKGLMIRISGFLCFAAIYDLACLIYIYLFIANTREGDGTQWMLAIFWWLLQDGLFKPLALAAILGNVSSLALYFFPDIEREVEEKWCQAPLPKPATSPALEVDKGPTPSAASTEQKRRIPPPPAPSAARKPQPRAPSAAKKPPPPPPPQDNRPRKAPPPRQDAETVKGKAPLRKPATSPAWEVDKIRPPESDPAPLPKPATSPALEAVTIPTSTWIERAVSPIGAGEVSSNVPAGAVLVVMAAKAAEDDNRTTTTALRVLADEKEITEGFAELQGTRRREESEAQSNQVFLPGQLGL